MTTPPSNLKEVCEIGESAARNFVLSKVDRHLLRSLNIRISSEKKENTIFSVDVSVDVEPVLDINVDELADQAAETALRAIDARMRGK